jgi:hypothetical protein
MKKTLLAFALLAATSAAFALDAPGQNWSTLTYNPSPIRGTPEDNNLLLQGRAEQGLIVGKVGGFKINTYGAVNYSYDRNGLAYNNKLSPEIGVKLQHDMGNNGLVEIGTAVVHQRSFRGVTAGPSSGTGVSVYGQYWFGWNAGKQ